MPFTIPNEADAAFADQAEIDSIDLAIMTAADAGTGVVSGCAVTAQGTPDMTVAVASGTALIAGTEVAVTGGNVTITAADGTNPRFDLVVVNNAGTKSATAGTAAANPVFPAIPANSVVLAAVYVPANDTAINSNQIVDKRVLVTSGGGGGNVATDTIWDAAGDLAQGTGSDTAARLARGTSLRDRVVVSGTSLAWLPHIIRKTSNSTVNNSTTPVNVTDLELSLAANERWFGMAYLIAQVGDTPDINLSWTFPTGATMQWGAGSLSSESTAPFGGRPTTTHAALLTQSSTAGFEGRATADNIGLRLEFFVVNGANAGTLQLQFAQRTATVSNTIVYADSILIVWRIL